jgi:hypothetical protein
VECPAEGFDPVLAEEYGAAAPEIIHVEAPGEGWGTASEGA